MNDGSRYAVDQFSLTDSTIVIEKWNLADERYKHVDLPMMVRRDDVKSIEELELDPGNSFWLLTSIGIGVVTLLVLFTPPGFD